MRKGWQPGFVEAKATTTSWSVSVCEMIIPETRILHIKINTVGKNMFSHLEIRKGW